MKYLLFFVFLFTWLAGTAQRQADYSSNNPKAIRLFESAIQLYDHRHNEKALSQIDEVLKTDSTFVEAYLLRAAIYEEQKKTDEAIKAYAYSLHFLPDFFPNTYLTLGKLYFSTGNYPEARKSLEKFLSYKKNNPTLNWEANETMKSTVFADSAVKNPVLFQPVNMGETINSADEEYLPAITADGSIFLFTRRSKALNDFGRPTQQEDFYESRRTKTGWSMAVPLTDINTTGNEGAPALSADGRYLFFTACQELSGYPGNKTGKGGCDIFLTRKDGNKWGEPRNLEAPVNTASWDAQPSFSSDGRTLYFVRKVKDKNGKTNSDILVSHIGDSSKWSEPVSVSDFINTSSDEMSVFIHSDDQTLYFSSDGHPGMGSLDIFMSRRQADGTWGEPVNLGYPINTSAEERSLVVSPAGGLAYFSSNRPEGRGGLDLYQFDLHPKALPKAITYMKGKVMDINTKEMLAANFELIDLASGKIIIRSTSDAINGEFLIALPSGRSYALNVSRKGYLFYSENFQLKDMAASTEPFLKDVLMRPMKAGESMVLNNIFFATDSFQLKPESKIELAKLVSFLKVNAELKIEISGHTDNVGDKKYNQGLSEKRAKSVYDYLVEAGTQAARLAFKGFGDTKPVAANTTEAGRAQNRRTEFLVVSVN